MAGEELIPLAGAGGDGSGAGAGGGGGTAVAEPPPDVDPEAGGTPGGDGGEGGGTPGDEGGKPGDREKLPGEPDEGINYEQDGRKVDDVTRKAISQLAKIDKVAARAVRDAYFKQTGLMKEFPEAKTFDEAMKNVRTMKQTLDSLGGEEGIEKLNLEVKDYRSEIDQFAKGDPALIEQLYESNPEATVQAAQNMLEIIGSKDQNALNTALYPSLNAKLKEGGLTGAMQKLLGHIKEGQGQEAFDLVKQIDKWLGDIDKKASEIMKGRTERDPREDEFQRREQSIRQKEVESRERSLGHAVTRLNNSHLAKVSSEFYNDMKFDPEAKREFTQRVMEQVWKTMKSDKAFQRIANGMVDKGDNEDAAAKFISDKFAELLPGHFEAYRKRMYPNYKRGSRPPAPKPGANGTGGQPPPKNPPGIGGDPAATYVEKKPAPNEIDWSKTTDKMFSIGRGIGHVWTTAGKFVKFDWAKQ